MGVKLTSSRFIASSMGLILNSPIRNIIFEDRSALGLANISNNADITYRQSYDKLLSGNLFGKANPLFRIPEWVNPKDQIYSNERAHLGMDMNGSTPQGNRPPPMRRLKASSRITIGNGANGAFPMLVTISENSTISINQVKTLLEQITIHLKQAPFSKYIRGRPINVSMVSQKDLKALGYYRKSQADSNSMYAPAELFADRYPLGVYDSLLDAVLINTERFDELTESIGETLGHEFLHAYSTETNELDDGNLEVRSGLSLMVLSRDEKQCISEKGRYLNEGLTEYLRVRAGGSKPKGIYSSLYQTISILIDWLGEDILIEAYFNGNTEKVRKAWNDVHGAEAYWKLSRLADRISHDYHNPFTEFLPSIEKREADLIGFATHGYEYIIMENWGYSPEDRSRAPRQLSPSEIPQEIRRKLNGVAVFTNLTKDDLDRFFINIKDRSGHHDISSFAEYIKIDKTIDWYDKEEKEFCIFIQYHRHEESEALLSVATIDHPNNPHFLGSAFCRHSWLCRVTLKQE